MTNMGKTTNTEETSCNIKKYQEMKNSAYNEIYNLEKEIKMLKQRIEKIENILMGICDHEWTYDQCYGMYEKPDKICKLCDSRIIRF